MMQNVMVYVRAAGVALAVIILGVVLSCGGGSRRAANVLPTLDGATGMSSGNVDRTASIPEEEIGRLDPVLQKLYGDPGWYGPPTPQAPATPAPAPPALEIEEIIAQVGMMEPVERATEPVVPTRGTSFTFDPPPPDYFPAKGEYDEDDYDGSDPPPWGSEGDDEDLLEDRIQLVSELSEIPDSFVELGVTRGNQFNQGTQLGGDPVSAVFQAWSLGPDSGEWSYPADETFEVVPEAAYWVDGMIWVLSQMPATVRRFNQLGDMAWYDVLIAPLDDLSDPYESTGTGTENETYASYQPFTFDESKVTHGDEAWMVQLVSSANEDIQGLIDEQAAAGPVATYPVFGTIFQRWADDVWNVGVDNPWEGRLGWPLGRWMFIDRGGRLLTGPLGQYYRYGQYFEKGFMWWHDYLAPDMPDEVYIYMYDKDSTLESGGEYTQDAAVVRYGMGGPLGCIAFVNPTFANVGDPIYFKAFPYGGPLDNANGFDDDWFLWNFRDGTVTGSSIQFPIHEYYVEAKYTPRVMFTLDYDGDGLPDGDTEGYKVFADTADVTIGHLGGGGGGGAAKIVLVAEDTPYPGDDNVTAVAETLDSIGIPYDTTYESDISSVADLEDYLLTIWCFHDYPDYGYQYVLSEAQSDLMMDVTRVNSQNLLVIWNRPYYYYNWYQFSDRYEWPNYWGSSTYSYPSATRYITTNQSLGFNTAGKPLGSGPGGSFSMINWEWEPYPYIPGYYQSPYFSYIWYSYAGSSTVLAEGPYYYYVTSWMRDTNGNDDNGIATWFGLNWFDIEGTTPEGPGRDGVMQNLLNQINPELLEGGSGGDDDVMPWDGPVDIADVFAYVYAADGSEISGGDGDTVEDRASVSVTSMSGPQTIWFECLARAQQGIDLVYEWEFEPSAGFDIWTQYTAHEYDGGIDPDGDGGPLETGDPFPVNVRVYDSSYTYGTAPPESRDEDSVLVEVHGPLPVDIYDNGTVFESMYEPDEVTGDVTFTLNYKIDFGDPPYDAVYVDYDYDFLTFDETLFEVTPTPGQGAHVVDVTIPDAEAREYYIAIKVVDANAPNGEDVYAWMDPVKVGAPVVFINDNITTSAYNALTGDLDDIGLGYNEVSASSLTAADLEGAELVIWHGKDNASSYYPSRITSTIRTILTDYWDDGGNTLMIIPYEYYYYMGGGGQYTWLQNYWNISTSYPYAWLYGYYSYYYRYYDNCPTFNGVNSGPGGTVSNISYGKSSYPQHMSYLYNGYNRITSSDKLIQAGNYYSYYLRSWKYETVGGGNNVPYGAAWHDTNDSSMTGTRSGLLRNLVEVANPDLM